MLYDERNKQCYIFLLILVHWGLFDTKNKMEKSWLIPLYGQVNTPINETGASFLYIALIKGQLTQTLQKSGIASILCSRCIYVLLNN